MDTVTLPHVEPAPPGPDLSSQVAALQRLAERHKAALARLEKTLAKTRGEFRLAQDHLALWGVVAPEIMALLREGRPEEALLCMEETRLAVLVGRETTRRRSFALAQKRDTAVLTLREKVKALYAALSLARRALDSSPYQFAPLMQEITRALGE